MADESGLCFLGLVKARLPSEAAGRLCESRCKLTLGLKGKPQAVTLEHLQRGEALSEAAAFLQHPGCSSSLCFNVETLPEPRQTCVGTHKKRLNVASMCFQGLGCNERSGFTSVLEGLRTYPRTGGGGYHFIRSRTVRLAQSYSGLGDPAPPPGSVFHSLSDKE